MPMISTGLRILRMNSNRRNKRHMQVVAVTVPHRRRSRLPILPIKSDERTIPAATGARMTEPDNDALGLTSALSKFDGAGPLRALVIGNNERLSVALGHQMSSAQFCAHSAQQLHFVSL